MSRPSDDDREAVDRAFAELVAGYHLTSDRPDPLLEQPKTFERGALDQAAEPAPTTIEAPNATWADSHPLFQFPDPPAPEEQPEPEDVFVPEPPGPLPRPAWPVLIAWIAMGYAVLAVLAVTLGAHLPIWAGWLAVLGFVGGFGVLLIRLPRHRPPDAGNGAVL